MVTGHVQPARKKLWLWLVATAVILFVGFGMIAALVYFSYRLGSESAKETRPPVANISPAITAKPTSSVMPSSTPTVESSSNESNSNSDGSDEVTPISWGTSVVSFRPEIGKRYEFLCPPAGTAGTVWGSDIYTADSSICTAAVHAGKITLEQGGEITIEIRPGRSIYGSTTRNGITSNPFGEFAQSIVFK
jgi:heme/copper-type cytochrome/quinol oxidase subunit 2